MKKTSTEQLKKFEGFKITNLSAIKGGRPERVNGPGASVRRVDNVA